MNDINSSLIGFLKKKSLFSDSPGKSLRFRERSKDKQNLSSPPKPPQNFPERTLNHQNSMSSQNLHQESSLKDYGDGTVSEVGHQSMAMDRPTRFFASYSPKKEEQPVARRNFNFKTEDDSKSKKSIREEENTNIWKGLVNHASSFESSRIESSQCLEGMAVKLQTELSSINYKIDVFHNKMTQILNREFENMKEKIYMIVSSVFEESEQNIRSYVKQQEEILAGELLHMKETLISEYRKVETMKEDINSSTWRKVAGELLSSEMETKIEELLIKSRAIDIGQWEIGDLGGAKVADLEGQLRDIIRLNNVK